MIEEQAGKIEQRIDALLLVGGFAGSEYLFRKVEASFWRRAICYRSSESELCVCRPSSLARLK